MLKINKQTITLTKGDDASLGLVPRYKDRTEYVLTEGDRAVFRIKFGHTLVELECTLNLETNKIVANITPNDTKDFNPGIYRYEAELITSYGFHYTFIADQTFILGQEYEQRITSTSNGNSSAIGGNLPEIDGVVDGEPVVYGDIQLTNPMMDYDELNHLPKLNNKTIKGDHDSEYYGIATKTSELENDSDFVSDENYVHTDNNYDDTAKDKVDALGTASTYDVPESGNAGTSQVVKGDDTRLTDSRNPNPHTHSKADITDFPTNVSAFNNDSGFITNTVNNLANYYLKTQTYTQTEVDNLISAAVSGRFQKVNTLPASGQPNVIYLVPKADPETSNTCDEYIWQDNAWELIGSTEVDLSDYVTDDELTTALQSYLTTSAFNTAIANYYTKTETDNLLANKVDKVAGKGLSTNDYDNTAKGIVDGVTSALNDKVDKVQGKGLSTNDYDNTAKGIVDGVTSALADKVDKVNGKGLSTEDYTTAEKTKLGAISDEANKVTTSSTNGHINIDGVDATVYDDSAVTSAISAMGDDIEDIQDELSTDSATVEGNPLNFSTLSAQTAESTIIDLEPIQDLHGYDHPWVGGANVNKCDTEDVTKTSAGYIIGTNSGKDWINENHDIFSAGTYIFSFYASDFTNNSASQLTLFNNDTSVITKTINNISGRNIITVSPESDFNKIALYTNSATGGKFTKMQFESGEQVSEYRPYANICSISGYDEVDINGCGENVADVSNAVICTNVIESLADDGTITFKDVSTSTWATSYIGYFDIVKGQTYTIKCDLVYGRIGFTIDPNVSPREGYYPKTSVSNPNTVLNYATKSNTFVANETRRIYLAYCTDSNISAHVRFQAKISIVLGNELFAYTPYQQSTSLQIQLGETVYGGQLDVENGVLVCDRTIYDMGDLVYTKYSGYLTSSEISDMKFGLSDSEYANEDIMLCSAFDATNNLFDDTNGCIRAMYNNNTLLSAKQIVVFTDAYASASDFRTAMTGQKICYKLATPTTLQLTPNTINLLKGVNNISTDGDKITLTYRDGSVATLGDLTSAVDNLDSKIDESKILTDTATGDKYILVVTNGVLSVEQISN